MNTRFQLSLLGAKAINKIIDLIAKDRGSNFSGEKMLLLDPRMVEHFKNIDPQKMIFITGTNGKSSSTNLVTHVLRENGYKVVSNLEGANLLSGIATSLSKESDLSGKVEADYYVFEVDERFLPLIYDQLPAKNLLIMNLQKDQVQRNGDPNFIYKKLDGIVNDGMHLFLNNDDPRSKSFEDKSKKVTTFGVKRGPDSYLKDDSYPTMACPKCSAKIEYDYFNSDNLGHFHCTNCGFSSDVSPDYELAVDDENVYIDGVKLNIPYNVAFMFYNYVGAYALVHEIAGISLEDFNRALESFKNITGRIESFDYKGKTVKYFRIKQENPDTLQNALNTIAKDKHKKSVYLGFDAVEDIVPGYTNTFYLFDCDFKPLINSNVAHYYCFTPTSCYDTALRLLYDGADKGTIDITESDKVEDFFKQLEKDPSDTIYLITLLHKFEELKNHAKS